MWFFYSLEKIQTMFPFTMFDFSTFSDFQNIVVLLGVNIFILLFWGSCVVVLYKSVNRIINIIF